METTGATMTETIIETINTIFLQFFSSIDSTLYELLDKLVFLGPDILEFAWFEKIFQSHGILLIANALLLGVCIYYGIRLFFSYFIGTEAIEKPYHFIFKLLLFGLCINFSFFLSEQFLTIHSYISESIRELGKNLTGKDISFLNLIEKLNRFTVNSDFTIFSFDGILKSFISISLLNLLFTYALRYIMLLVFIILFPFALLTLMNYSTRWFFQSWSRCFFSLLILEYLVDFILLLIFSIPFEKNQPFSMLLLLGCMYALIRANHYIQQLVGGISISVTSNISSLLKPK